MAKPYSNDLRRKFLQSYDRGRGSLRQLAEQYCVSLGWAKKISARRTRTGQIDFVPYQRGRKSRVTEEIQQWLRLQVRQQADLTLAELKQKLVGEKKIQLSQSRLWKVLKDLGLRLKKSHFMPRSGKRRRHSNDGKPGKKRSER
jgi:transposase